MTLLQEAADSMKAFAHLDYIKYYDYLKEKGAEAALCEICSKGYFISADGEKRVYPPRYKKSINPYLPLLLEKQHPLMVSFQRERDALVSQLADARQRNDLRKQLEVKAALDATVSPITNTLAFEIEYMPRFEAATEKDKLDKTKTKKPRSKSDSTKAKSASRKRPGSDSPMSEEVFKIMTKDFPLKKFKFKSHSECKTSDSKKIFYVSKDDIIKMIATDPELQKFFPKNFKSMTKKAICDSIFK